MTLDREAREKLVRALAGSMIEHAEELTSLDQAIGDGDHGLNMKRGFEAVLATLPGLADKSLPEMLKAIGLTLVMKVGGASGPLVGTFFMELGKALPEQPARADLVAAADKAIEAVKMRGMPGRSRPRRRKPPIAPRRCLRPAAGRPFSAKDPSATWTRARARRLS